MRYLLIIIAVLLIYGCALEPEAYRMGSNVTASNQNFTQICGDEASFFGVFWFDDITANIIAVDDIIAPEFEAEKHNLIGVKTLPNLLSYCLEVSQGSHKITILAERERGVTWGGTPYGLVYYIGECTVTLEENHNYLITPIRAVYALSDVVIHLTDKDRDKLVVNTCKMAGPMFSNDVFKFLSDLRAG